MDTMIWIKTMKRCRKKVMKERMILMELILRLSSNSLDSTRRMKMRCSMKMKRLSLNLQINRKNKIQNKTKSCSKKDSNLRSKIDSNLMNSCFRTLSTEEWILVTTTCLRMKCSSYKQWEALEEVLKTHFILIEIDLEDRTRDVIEELQIFTTFRPLTTGQLNEERLFLNYEVALDSWSLILQKTNELSKMWLRSRDSNCLNTVRSWLRRWQR